MIAAIWTPAPQFANDMADVLRIFLGNVEVLVNAPGGDMTVTHTETVSDGVRECRVVITGAYAGASRRLQAVCGDALEEKRYHKRQLKGAVYDVMKAATGRTPPWGSLTGIRPTRLVYAALNAGQTLEQATETVESTFDVRPDKASLLRKIVTVQQDMSHPRADEVDLYMGIPFCVSRCAYCSFLSGEVGRGDQLLPYVEALERETARTLRLVERAGLTPRAFYMGGGTPTALPAPLLRRALAAARPFLRACREITVEAGRPDTIDREKLSVILEAGAGRISINPQTMHDETLARIGRRHTRAQTEAAYALARAMGFHHINMDLIAGLPGEDLSMFAQTLAWSEAMAPESLTVHTLSIKRSSLLHLWEAALPDGAMVEEMVRLGAESAQRRGMRPYYLYRQKYMAGNLENVGYALPGHECLYNVDMMEETGSVLAVGAGAISKRVYPGGGYIQRAPNVSDIAHYIARADERAARKDALYPAE